MTLKSDFHKVFKGIAIQTLNYIQTGGIGEFTGVFISTGSKNKDNDILLIWPYVEVGRRIWTLVVVVRGGIQMNQWHRRWTSEHISCKARGMVATVQTAHWHLTHWNSHSPVVWNCDLIVWALAIAATIFLS